MEYGGKGCRKQLPKLPFFGGLLVSDSLFLPSPIEPRHHSIGSDPQPSRRAIFPARERGLGQYRSRLYGAVGFYRVTQRYLLSGSSTTTTRHLARTITSLIRNLYINKLYVHARKWLNVLIEQFIASFSLSLSPNRFISAKPPHRRQNRRQQLTTSNHQNSLKHRPPSLLTRRKRRGLYLYVWEAPIVLTCYYLFRIFRI